MLLATDFFSDFTDYQKFETDEAYCRSREQARLAQKKAALGKEQLSSNPNEAVDSEKTARDYCAQRRATLASERQAVYAGLALGVGFAALLAAGVAAIAAGIAAKGTHDTVLMMQRATHLENRAWLKVEPVLKETTVKFKGDNIHVHFTIEAKNISTKPAVEIHAAGRPYRARGFVVGKSGLDSLIAFERMVLALPNRPKGAILMPNDAHWFGFSADAKTDAATEAKYAEQRAIIGDTWTRPVSLSAACVVFYRSTTSHEWHQTAHVLYIRKKDGTEFDPSLGDVDSSNLGVRILSGDSEVT